MREDARREHADPHATRAPAYSGIDLHGDLQCARCRYNLRGLSITGVCPECALPVRVTILLRVDPHAHELQPIEHRGLVAWGIVVWSACGLLASMCVWWLRFGDLAPRVLDGSPPIVRTLVALFVALSGIGAIAFVRPHAGIPRRMRLGALLACVLYIPLVLVLWKLHAQMDTLGPAYGTGVIAPVGRTVLRVLAGALLAGILLSLRPAARLLAARSFLMRTGRTDRQTMAAMLAVLGVIAIGDALVLWAGQGRSGVSDLFRQVGQLIILIGSVLFTVGIVGVVVDCWRLRGVILEPPLSLRELLSGKQSPGQTPDTPVPHREANREATTP